MIMKYDKLQAYKFGLNLRSIDIAGSSVHKLAIIQQTVILIHIT